MTLPNRLIKPFCWLVVALFVAFMVSVVRGNPADIQVQTSYAGQIGMGSGTVIAVENGKSYVLTCHHNIQNHKTNEWARSISVVTTDGRRYRARYLNGRKGLDLALLEASFENEAYAPPAPAKPQEFWIAGYSHGTNYRVRQSKFIQREADGADSFTGLAIQGESGGGIFNGNGELIGVVHATNDQRQVTFATCGPILGDFVQKTLTKYNVQCYGGSCQNRWIPQGRVMTTPQIQVQPQPPRYIQRPSPQQQPTPKPTTNCDCKDRLAKLESQQTELLKLTDRVVGIYEKHDSRLAALESREPQRGPPGQDGKDGRDGTDAVVDIDALAQAAAQIVIKQQSNRPAPEVNYKQLAKEILSQSQVLVDAIPAER